MTMRRPKIQLQLREPITGRYDCTAYEAAVAGDADSKGAIVFTGRQIRLASDEPIPDRVSPGLNLRQADEALFRLSHGKINLDTRWNTPWAGVVTRVDAGAWAEVAVWREVLLDHGIGRANSFGKGHALLFGKDQDTGRHIYNDPLLPEWLEVTPAVMGEAARELLIRSGVGAPVGAYVSITRDVFDEHGQPKPVRHSVHFKAGASFFVYHVNAGTLKIVDPRTTRVFQHNTSAPSEPIRPYYWPRIRANRRLARITKGTLAGLYVEPGAFGVVEVVS